jgi:hypothetical protein
MVFTLQKRIVRIMSGAKPRNSFGSLLVRLGILPLPCEYVFSVMNFVVNNQEHFETNSAMHVVNIRKRNHLQRSLANLSCFKKSA